MYQFLKKQILKSVTPFLQPQIVGLDISDRTFKFFKFKTSNKISIDYFGRAEIPAGVVENGEIKNEEVLSRVLSEARTKKIIRSSLVAASLPEEKCFVRLIQLPKIKKEEITGAIRWELEANVPIPLDELYFDYEIIEPLQDHLDHYDVMIMASPKLIVDSYIRVLKAAGFTPYTFELESQAIIRSVIPILRDERARIVVDMGRARTSLIIFAGGAIIFTNTIEIGGYSLEQNIAATLKADPKAAEKFKKEVGLDKRANEGKVFAALVPLVSVLSDELLRAMQFYQGHAAHGHGVKETISEILLIGGEASLFGLDTYLSGTLKVPVRLANPFVAVQDRLQPPIPIISKKESYAYATAIGLALRGSR